MSDNKDASKETEQPDVAADEIGEFSFFSASTLDEVKEKQAPSRQQGKKRYELFVDGNGKASESSVSVLLSIQFAKNKSGINLDSDTFCPSDFELSGKD